MTVTHPGQVMQCSHCFCYVQNKYSREDKCPARGVGEGCKELGQKNRAKMSDYMLLLEENVKYISLKTEHFRKNPILKKTFRVNETESPEESDAEEVSLDETVVQNPVMKMAKKIEKLGKENDEMKKQTNDMKTTKENLRNQSMLVLKEEARISHASKLTEKKAVEAIVANTDPLQEDAHLLTMLVLIQDRDKFEVEPVTHKITPADKEAFLNTVTEEVSNFLKENPKESKEIFLEKVKQMKEQVILRLKDDQRFQPGSTANPARRDWLRRRESRRNSTASNSSKRSRSTEMETEEKKTLSKQQKPGSSLTQQ